MTDQNNSGNSNPVPAQVPPPTQQVPNSNWNGAISIPVTNAPVQGQWITYTITGGDLAGSWTVQAATPAQEKKAKKKPEEDGCVCKKCKQFYQYAEPNQEDGTLICYSCRQGW